MTGYVTSSNCGGNFGYYLKKAGLDGLILCGHSETPVWLELRDGQAVFHPADGLWGQKTEQTLSLIHISKRVIRQVDVAPTIAALLGMRMPAQCEGAPIYQILANEF